MVVSRKRTYELLLIVSVGFEPIKLFIDKLFFFMPGTLIDVFFYTIYLGLLLCHFKDIFPLLSIRKYILLGFWFAYCLFMVLSFGADRMVYLETYIKAMPRCFFFFVTGFSFCYHFDKVEQIFEKLPIVLLAFQALNFILYGVRGEMVATSGYVKEITYSMELGHACIFPVSLAVVMFFFHDRRKIVYLLTSILGMILIIGAGSRSPVVCVLVVVLICITIKKAKKVLYVLISVAVLGFLAFVFQKEAVLSLMEAIFGRIGLSTRIIDALSSMDIFSFSNRDSILGIALSGIKEHPFLGLGVFRDRLYLFENWETYLKNYHIHSISYYPHNIFVELFMQFGVFMGGILILFLVKWIKNSFQYARKSEQLILYLPLLSTGFLIFLFSKSYVMTPAFYLFLGYAISLSEKAGSFQMWKGLKLRYGTKEKTKSV